MPSLDIFEVDWKEAQKRYKQGTLRSELCEDSEDDEGSPRSEKKWAEDLGWFEKAPADYFDVADAWEQMSEESEGVPPKMHKAAMDFVSKLITYEDYHNDLEEEGEDFLIAISPDSAAKLAKLAGQVDFSLYRNSFETNCVDAIENLSVDSFLSFMKVWSEMISKAAKEKKGLLFILE